MILFHHHTPDVIKQNLKELFVAKYHLQPFIASCDSSVMSILVHEQLPKHLESLFNINFSQLNANMWYFME